MKDWLVRALKTFVQAFFGVLVPEIVVILNGSLPTDITAWQAVLVPLLTSALAAGISAAGNIIMEHLKEEG